MTDLRSRLDVQQLREDAEEMAEAPGTNEHWVRAYRDLADVLDRLDAMMARSSVGTAGVAP